MGEHFHHLDGEYFIPLRGKALRKFTLLHSPPASDPLAGKKQRITTVNTVDCIHNRHEASLPKLFCQRALSEQIRLKSILRGNPGQIHASLFVPEPVLINSIESVERRVYQIRGKRRWVG